MPPCPAPARTAVPMFGFSQEQAMEMRLPLSSPTLAPRSSSRLPAIMAGKWWSRTFPTWRSGRMGVEARRLELKKTGAKVIVDARHPFASEISKQLIELASELGIAYLRYERPVTQNVQGAILCRDIEEAVEKAMAHGTRIFLATGSKDLATFLKQPKAAERQWFARIAPDTESLQKALGLGIPRGQLCVMQGPFTQEFNQMLWKNWQIDCVVTKDSGEAGGFEAKEQAARSLGIPLIVVQRPVVAYPAVAHDFQTIIQQLAPSCK